MGCNYHQCPKHLFLAAKSPILPKKSDQFYQCLMNLHRYKLRHCMVIGLLFRYIFIVVTYDSECYCVISFEIEESDFLSPHSFSFCENFFLIGKFLNHFKRSVWKGYLCLHVGRFFALNCCSFICVCVCMCVIFIWTLSGIWERHCSFQMAKRVWHLECLPYQVHQQICKYNVRASKAVIQNILTFFTANVRK